MHELLFLMPWGWIKKGWDRLISRNHMLITLLKIIGTARALQHQQQKQNNETTQGRRHVNMPAA